MTIQCTVIGDEIASGIYGALASSGYQVQGVAQSGWNTGQLCYGFRTATLDPECCYYVIAVGSHDGGMGYRTAESNILAKIRNARNGKTAPRVVYVRPAQYANPSYSGFCSGGIADLYNWSMNWVPSNFLPNDNSLLGQLYKAFGFTRFPAANPFPATVGETRTGAPAAFPYGTLTFDRMKSGTPYYNNLLTYYAPGGIANKQNDPTLYSNMVNILYKISVVVNANPALAATTTYTAASTAFANQQSTGTMTVPGGGWSGTYSQWLIAKNGNVNIQDNRMIPTAAGFSALANSVRNATGGFSYFG